MTVSVAVCSSIEGEAIKIQTRQWFERLPRCMPDGRQKRSFKLGINSIAAIEEEYSDKANVEYSTSKTSKGDKLIAESIDGSYYSNRPIKTTKIKGSAAHSATGALLRGGVYAHIEVGKRDIMQGMEIEKRHPEVKQVKA